MTDSRLARGTACVLSVPVAASVSSVPPGQEATTHPAAPTSATAADLNMKCLRDGVTRC
ncbi:hypothetical protein ACIRO3_26365 [Streptomyces sp. NPDC102278]|uniref:hypothetical protein n=1 Tax=Streptomyces sp. NPDC102278 TaxID=3366152 RepID=UPI00380C1B5C